MAVSRSVSEVSVMFRNFIVIVLWICNDHFNLKFIMNRFVCLDWPMYSRLGYRCDLNTHGNE